ncbi:NocA-like transcription factor [Saccoglossus kowalevskii]|uniref:NocA-like transcription factor n=1 Tax=Saccoglossus kowalevskii TaxID=10224 RepID=D1LX90_SACKO|nr:NocA-like transcription factor [Saccoglossus kowalevskii]ACY92596.1 NocA-like transcription factor [Saccoglossus kowalevskii]
MSNSAPVKPLENNVEKPRSDPDRQAKRLPIRAINMLSARSQHILHTEYLQPLPTPPTYDAKKSPLALLAQTCSSIGKPDPPVTVSHRESKSSTTHSDSLSNKSSSNEKSTSTVSMHSRSSFTPYKQKVKREGDALITKFGYGKGTSPVTTVTPSNRTDSKPSAAASPLKRETPPLSVSASTTPTSTPRSSPNTNHISHTGISLSCGSMHVEVNHHESTGKHLSTPTSSYKPGDSTPPAASQAPTLVPVPAAGTVPAPTTSACGCSPQVVGHAIQTSDANPTSPTMRAVMSVAAAAHCTPKHSHNHGLGGSPLTASSAPYAATYARVKTADGGATFMPICSDPYCKNCQSAQFSAATANCTQCRHDTPSYSGLNGAIPVALPLGTTFPAYALQNGVTTPSYLYPHTMTLPAAAPATSVIPGRDHVCNWVSGSTSCGKRFSSSEELLQHLRSHTMVSNDTYHTQMVASPLAGTLNPCHLYYTPTAAGHAAAFPRPTLSGGALSPLSALRYHPYKHIGLNPSVSTAGATLSSIPLPAAAFYSPYPYFDLKQRLPTAVPH